MTIRVGSKRDPALPSSALVETERGELARLLGLREELQAQLVAVEAQMQLLLLNARDRRGLAGPVSVNVKAGTIVSEEVQDG